jgi:3',5'-cyclic AMP phosphodiesterase CpdA
MRIAVASDSHLSSRTPEAQRNWEAVVRHVAAAPAGSEVALLLHLGDLSMDGAGGDTDLRLGRALLDRLTVPWHALPGNHDVGDNPGPGPRDEAAIDDERRARWLGTVGADRFSLRGDGWTLLGVNALLFDSGLAAEDEQWRWLEDEARRAGRDGERVALFSHKPVAAAREELAAAPRYRFVPAAARARLAALAPALVVSGHVHQHRVLEHAGARHLWAPTTWAVLPERAQRSIGDKRCGMLVLELGEGGRVGHERVEPAGLAQLTLEDDFPDPYHAPPGQ